MILDLFRLFFFNIKLCISRNIQYRIDFLLNLFIGLGLSSIAPIIQYLIFTRTNGYPGWNINQIILFQGCLLLWMGIKNTLFGEVRIKMNQLVLKGELDKVLLKPYPVIGVILTEGFSMSSIGSVIAGFCIIIYSVFKLSITISPFQIVLLIIMIVFGLILYLSLLIIYCSVNILITFIGRLSEIFDKLLRFSEYPVEIFPGLLSFLLISLVPIAVWVYMPAQILLNRFSLLNILFLAVSCIVIFFISIMFWHYSIKKYSSAGG